MPTCQDERYILALYSVDEDDSVTDRVELAVEGSYGVGPGAVYAPPPSQKVARGAASAYRHGADVVRVRYNNSTVEIRELTIVGTAEIMAERVMRLTTLLEKARRRQERGWGERVYIQRDWRHSTYYAWDIDPGPEYFYETVDVLSKEVFRGEFIPPREDVGGILRDGMLAPCRLNLECYPFWQGRERNVIFDYTVENHYCSVYPPAPQNWVNLDAADLPGDAPCLLKIRVTNVSGATEGIRTFRLGIKRQMYPCDSPCCDSLTYQVEDGTLYGLGIVLLAAGGLSCLTGARLTFADALNRMRVFWTPTGTQLPEGTYRVLARIRNNDDARTVLAQFRLSTPHLAGYFFEGDQVEVLTHTTPGKFTIADLGLLEIPPREMGGLLPATGYRMELWLQTDVAGSTTDMDYVLLLPVEGGLKLISIPTLPLVPAVRANWITDDVLELDGFVDPPVAIVEDPGSGGYYDSPEDDLGFAAYLQPGHDHCLVFSADRFDATEDKEWNDIDTVMRVSIDIIPQYLYIR